MAKDAGETARNHVGAAQVGVGECRENGSVALPACEIHAAYQPAEQSRRVNAAAVVDFTKGESCDRQCAAVCFTDGTLQFAPEGFASSKARQGIDCTVGLE